MTESALDSSLLANGIVIFGNTSEHGMPRNATFADNLGEENAQPYASLNDEDIMEDLVRLGEITNILVPVISMVILVFGLIGNAVVIYITLTTDRTANHPIHSLLVLNLASADILFLVVSGPYWVAINTASAWRLGAFLCPVIPFLSIGSLASSIFTICSLAWMRFMALIMPFRFRRSCLSTRETGYFVIVGTWISGIAIACPNLVYFRTDVMNEDQQVDCRWKQERASYVYDWFVMVFTYILPLLVVSFFYIAIGREVLCVMKYRIGNDNQRARNNSRSEEEKECNKSTMVVLGLILAFLICWFPHFLSTVLEFAGALHGLHHAKGRFILSVVSKCTGYAHACINPFVYTFASPNFRRTLRATPRKTYQQCCKGSILTPLRKVLLGQRPDDELLNTRRQYSNTTACPQLDDVTQTEPSLATNTCEFTTATRFCAASSVSEACATESPVKSSTDVFLNVSPEITDDVFLVHPAAEDFTA